MKLTRRMRRSGMLFKPVQGYSKHWFTRSRFHKGYMQEIGEWDSVHWKPVLKKRIYHEEQ